MFSNSIKPDLFEIATFTNEESFARNNSAVAPSMGLCCSSVILPMILPRSVVCARIESVDRTSSMVPSIDLYINDIWNKAVYKTNYFVGEYDKMKIWKMNGLWKVNPCPIFTLILLFGHDTIIVIGQRLKSGLVVA